MLQRLPAPICPITALTADKILTVSSAPLTPIAAPGLINTNTYYFQTKEVHTLLSILIMLRTVFGVARKFWRSLCGIGWARAGGGPVWSTVSLSPSSPLPVMTSPSPGWCHGCQHRQIFPVCFHIIHTVPTQPPTLPLVAGSMQCTVSIFRCKYCKY